MEPREDKKRKIQEYSPDVKELKKAKRNERDGERRRAETEEQRKGRLAKKNERDRAKRRAESVEHRATRLDKMSCSKQKNSCRVFRRQKCQVEAHECPEASKTG